MARGERTGTSANDRRSTRAEENHARAEVIVDDDGIVRTPRPLSGRGGRVDARERGRRASTASSAPETTIVSECASECGGESGVGRVGEGRRAGDARRAGGLRDESAKTRREHAYVSDTDALEAECENAREIHAKRDAAYAAKVKDVRASRAQLSESSVQTLETPRFDARSMTTTTKRETRAVQADELAGEKCDGYLADVTSERSLRVRVGVVRTIEDALRERERLEYCLKYRGLRPAKDSNERDLIELSTLKCTETAGMNVSCVKCNPMRGDLVCVAYGDFSFAGANSCDVKEKGALAFWSLRSEAPIYVAKFASGIMSVDWSRESPSLLAVGFYDGEVIVLDVGQLRPDDYRDAATSASFTSTYRGQMMSNEHRHNDPVWAVKWIEVRDSDEFECDESESTTSVLMSASTDGKVLRWDLHNGLHASEALAVRWSPPGNESGLSKDTSAIDGVDVARLAGVTCFDFAADAKYFVVGTEEGKVHQCSLDFSDQYVSSYASHIGPVYAIKYNPYHERIFITCSADWTLRVFMDDAVHQNNDFTLIDESSSRLKLSNIIQPRFVIEYGEQPINAVAWSPWCATEFAVVTDAGTIEIWDLASSTVVPKHEVQITPDRTAAVSVTYAHDAPVMYVGCATGSTRVFRINWRDPTEEVEAREIQRATLENIMNEKSHKH